MIITIDGPAGVGKSTTARRLAAAVGVAYLDTGATYRAVTLKALQDGVDLTDADALTAAARSAEIELAAEADGLRVTLDGQDVSDAIRTVAVTNAAHHVASCGPCRSVLVDLQRRLGAALGSFVAEGRDQGSVVFPDADVKFYLDADRDVRAERRQRDLADAGEPANIDDVLADIDRRDRRDRTRDVAPLVRPADAIDIETTDKSVEQVVDEMRAHVEGRACR